MLLPLLLPCALAPALFSQTRIPPSLPLLGGVVRHSRCRSVLLQRAAVAVAVAAAVAAVAALALALPAPQAPQGEPRAPRVPQRPWTITPLCYHCKRSMMLLHADLFTST
eukprot:2380517-Amphidinium_carterae.1